MSAPIPFRQLAVQRIGPVLSDETQGLTYQVGRQGVKAIMYHPDEQGFEVEGEEREGYWIPVANVVWGRKIKAAPVVVPEPVRDPESKAIEEALIRNHGRQRKGRAA